MDGWLWFGVALLSLGIIFGGEARLLGYRLIAVGVIAVVADVIIGWRRLDI